MASQSSPTTSAREVPRVIFSWQRRSWPVNTAPDKQRKALGRGLSALLPQRPTAGSVPPAPEPMLSGPQIASLAIADIQPNPLQPRSVFDSTRLEELANSIETHGIIQPILVRRQGSSYELIAGERRLRAAKLA